MKIIIVILSAAILITSAAGCSKAEKEDETASAEEKVSAIVHKKDEVSVSIVSELIESSESEYTIPDSIEEYKNGFLKYSDTSKKISAVFSSEFTYQNKEYTNPSGIFLTNADGSASLQIEAVDNKGINRNDLVDYLKNTYPDYKVYINDSKNIICKGYTTDAGDNKVLRYMKAIITDNGYNEAVLYFKEDNKSKYENIFNKISLS